MAHSCAGITLVPLSPWGTQVLHLAARRMLHHGSLLMEARPSAVLYMILKTSVVYEKGQALAVSMKHYFEAQTFFGKSVTREELCELGDQCTICQVRCIARR